jgi:iron complex transport system ATP-binding protein
MTTRESYFDGQHLEVWLGGRPVFTDLSLQLNRGEHTVVLGPNGSGKSSLIKLLTRELYPVVKPASSLRLFGDTTVNLWELRRRIGHVSADLQTTYSPVVTAADVVLSGLFGSVGIGRSQPATQRQRRQALELMEQLGLAGLAARRFSQLSDGQRRRLLLARALVHRPDLLVLDEPTNGLDPAARQQLLGWLSRLASSGTTLLLVTHQIEAIIPEIQRAVLLRNGTVMAEGSADQWLQSAPLSTLFATPLQLVESGGWRQLLPAAEPGIDGRVAPQTPGLPVG